MATQLKLYNEFISKQFNNEPCGSLCQGYELFAQISRPVKEDKTPKILQGFTLALMISERHSRWAKKQLPEMFYKKGVLKNFAKFTRNHLCNIFKGVIKANVGAIH